MDIKAIKELAQKYTVQELNAMADQLEQSGQCEVKTKEDSGELMGDLLQAAEVRALMDQGHSLQEALREFSKRVRQVLE